MSKVGIVILNYNDYETTKKYIEEIKDYKVLDKIIIVDNNSSDNSYEKLKKYNNYNKKIEVIKAEGNKGYSYGNNIGIRKLGESNIDYVIISNPDITVSESSIVSLKEDLDKNQDIALIAPVINQLGEKIRGWKIPKYKDELLSNINYVQKIAKKKLFYDESKYDNRLTKVDVVSGCFFMIRKDVLNMLGNFDEGTFLYYEENILAHKLQTSLKKSYIDNNVEVTHNLSVSVDKTYNSIKKYKVLKTSQKYYVKYYLKVNLFGRLLLRFIYYISLVLSYIICFFKNVRSKRK